MMRWSNAVVPFSTMAVPEAMLEMLPLAAVFTTCIQFSGMSVANHHQDSEGTCSRFIISGHRNTAVTAGSNCSVVGHTSQVQVLAVKPSCP